MAKFVIKRSTAGFRFNLKAGNGEIILVSEIYTSKAACENGIESVRANAPEDGNYDRRNSSNNKYYFNLKAKNGQIIGTSEMYDTVAGRENGISSVKSNAPNAVVVEE